MSDSFYITTPIYYVNDRPHIGHVYTTTIADILARYHRLSGKNVFFLTGTDEHAAKVVTSAEEHGVSTQEWADRNAKAFQDAFACLGISNDDFIRTSEPRHKKKVEQYVQELMDTGDVYKGEYEGWYDVGQEEYLPENKAKEYDFNSPFNGKPLVRKKEKNYFFKLSHYEEKLLQLMEDQPTFVQPDARRNEVINRIREGLNDVPISRSGAGDWGIQVPGDDEHVIYVWIDALFNYLSTVDEESRKDFWPASVHLLAKDILWFHAVIWPALLIALNKDLPKQVYTHSFWISEGQKMSKSLGNFIDIDQIDSYVEKFSLDALRYFLAANGPLGANDSDFAEARFVAVYNSDLANDLGNLLSRVHNMIAKYCDGKIPGASDKPTDGSDEYELYLSLQSAVSDMEDGVNSLKLEFGLNSVFFAVRATNRYLEARKPWHQAKESDLTPLHLTLYTAAESLRICSSLLYPVMPERMSILRRSLGLTELPDLKKIDFWNGLGPGAEIGEKVTLFPRIEIEQPEETQPQEECMTEEATVEEDNLITYDDFSKVELKTAKVLEAEKVEGADKLLKLAVMVGSEKRQIVAGLARHYDAEDLVGKTVVIVANMKPATIRGVESQGMLLAASKGESVRLVNHRG